MQKSNPQPQGVSFIPITLAGDKDPVTQACTVTFEATASDGSEPNLSLEFFEVQQTSSGTSPQPGLPHQPSVSRYDPITVTNPPTPIWNNGIATFALSMNSAIFSQLSSNQTHFAVDVSVDGDRKAGWGECIFAINLGS